jgi:hypothetical protein
MATTLLLAWRMLADNGLFTLNATAGTATAPQKALRTALHQDKNRTLVAATQMPHSAIHHSCRRCS